MVTSKNFEILRLRGKARCNSIDEGNGLNGHCQEGECIWQSRSISEVKSFGSHHF